MNQGQTIFSQIIDYIPRHSFYSCVNKYHGDYRVRTFTCLGTIYSYGILHN